MSGMTSPGFISFGAMPYDDVYLEDGTSEEDTDEHVTTDSRKPLMSPRKRAKVALRQPKSAVGVYPLIKKRFLKWFYVLITLIFLVIMAFVLMRITHDAMQEMDDTGDSILGGEYESESYIKPFSHHGHVDEEKQVTSESDNADEHVIPCTHFDVEDVWVQNFPKLITETAFRLVDVNKDGVLDVIMGFTTEVTAYFTDQYLLCNIYFNGTQPCFGGLMALDGVTGNQLWRRYSDQEIFAVNCNVDIDRDGVKDCLGAGRSGVFMLVSGASGDIIWTFKGKELLVSISNFYTAQFIRDVDGDGIEDVLNIHGGDPLRRAGEKVSHVGILVILSGATGHVISHMEVPDKQESYYSPQVYYQNGGREMVLFGSGGETHGGSLWAIPMADLLEGDDSVVTRIYTDNYKGVMTPPALVDITGDGVVDIVMSMFNSTVVAFDGQNYKQLWNYTTPESETYSSPGVAYFNDDDVPDFMIVYNHGPGYPVYYYSQVTVLDGRTGKPLLNSPIRTAGSSQTSPLSISVEGQGNDAFIYFTLDCKGHEGEMSEFEFAKGELSGTGGKSRSNFCKQRFNTSGFSHLLLLNRHMTPPGEQIYNSLDRVADEYQYTVNSSLLAKAFLESHPHVLEQVMKGILDDFDDHDHDGTGHSEDGGDQNTDDKTLNPEKQSTNKFAPRLGFDDENQSPYFGRHEDSKPVDDQQRPVDPNPQNVDLQNVWPDKSADQQPSQHHPEWMDPQKDRSKVVDPHMQKPVEKQYPQNPLNNDLVDHVSASDDSEMTDQLLDELLNELLQNDELRELVDQRDDSRGNPESRKDLSQSFLRDLKYPQESRKPYEGDRFSTRGETRGRKRDDRYDDTDRNERKWIERRYDGFRKKRDANLDEGTEENRHLVELFRDVLSRYKNHDETRSKKEKLTLIEYLNNELFTKLSERKSESVKKAAETQKETDNDDQENTSNERKLPIEYLDKELFTKLQERYDRNRRKQSSNQDEAFIALANHRQRYRRHAGPHDAGGVQRLISTGTLAPVLLGQGSITNHSIDLIFATYWFYPSATEIILPDQQKCIDEWTEKESQRLDPKSVFYGLDHDAYEHMAVDKCTKGSSKAQKAEFVANLTPLEIYPFNVHTGELTVYRLRLTCRCNKTTEHDRCAYVLPYDKQQWAGYMGTYGTSHFAPRT